MARPARPRSTPAAIQARTQQLLERDPVLVALRNVPALSDRSKEQQRHARDLEVRLSLKYGAGVFPWPIPGEVGDYRTRGEDFSARYLPGRDANAEPPIAPGGTTFLTRRPGPIDPIMATDPPRFRVLVRLDLVTEHDIERLAQQFRAALKGCLRQTGREQQHALRWLRTVAPAVFNQALRRYDLHMQQGLTFRQIAYLEREERRGHALAPGQLRGVRVSIEPGRESSVREAVQKIYRSIHRVPYRARRQGPGDAKVPPYDCPTHPRGDCPLDCPVLLDWVARVTPSLPKPNSGA
jgi:hypothetical protein